ncbi:transposable element Tcb2 transposase [Trichonephila clavipes]|nr:transposable element Tcb2 transposase [Trichonephila clavipes]
MSFTRRPGSRRRRQSSRREDRHIARTVRVLQTASSAPIQAHVAPSLRAPVSFRTKRMRLAEDHLGSRDESRFNLSSGDNLVRVWRPRVERLNPAFELQQQRHTASTAGVMDFTEVINRIVVEKIPNPTDINLVWVPI